MRTPDEIRISNRATYWPVAPIDLVVGAPLVVRALLGVTPLGRVVQAVVLGAYLGSAARDWRDRRGIRRIDFRREFGADLHHLLPMPRERRETEVRALVERLNDDFAPRELPRRELAVEVDRHLTDYIAGITGQRVRTSTEVRGFALSKLAFPFAVGACDVLSGDIAIFKDLGPLEPHVLAHEFCHRKGYWKELHAQVLAYLALVSSGEPILRQAARLERFYRHLRVLAGPRPGAFERLAAAAGLRPELGRTLAELRPPATAAGRQFESGMRQVYHARMRITGQTGISDYDLGFTNFLYTFETSTTARQTPPGV
ncbi:MAG TPA: hypothetical protein VKA83_10605 [Methylomirabilota bacterium]|nr:hypothetical protein [Methylomirabilota bacterium]